MIFPSLYLADPAAEFPAATIILCGFHECVKKKNRPAFNAAAAPSAVSQRWIISAPGSTRALTVFSRMISPSIFTRISGTVKVTDSAR